jgi:prepilin peptidase CpaA
MQYAVLVATLFICLITDIKSRKIFNIITIPSIIFGFIFNIYTSGFDGFLYSGNGLLMGFGLLIIPFLLGGMGAGDVKLMGAIGALMGPNFVFYSFIYTALFGGVIALLIIIKTKGFINLLKSIYFNMILFRSNLGSIIIPNERTSSISFPYGIAIVLGTLCQFVWGELE